MLGLRRARALAAAAVVATGMAAAAPVAVHASTGTGCQGTFTLSAGQTAQCSFVYAGPGSSGWWTDDAGGWVSGTAAVAQFRLQAAGTLGATQILDHCEAVSITFGGACVSGTTSSGPPVPVGTVVLCVVEVVGPGVASGSYSCDSGF